MAQPIGKSPETIPQIKTVRATGAWQGQMRTVQNVRTFAPITIAEPEKLGGDNAAPTPMEYVIAALNGCLAVAIELVAKEQGFRLEGMEFESEGLIDQRGLFGTASVSPHFQEVVNRIRFKTPESPERLADLKAEVTRRCPAYSLIKDAGVTIRLDWTIA